jgi:16S rRNA (adenine1518-N6/adenine1519-N6)-dimethyltransferase
MTSNSPSAVPHPRHVLAQYGIPAKKSLGQNFLFDENILQRIVDSAEIKPTDHVLEVGPGLGSLTRVLADSAESVTAVELDQRFVSILEVEFGGDPSINLIHGDILKQDPALLFPDHPYKVVANVPYYITGAILRQLLSATHKPELLVLTVQNEVSVRLSAEPGKLSLLAVSVQCYGTVERVMTIKAGSFWPAPDVDSAVVKITLTDDAPIQQTDEALFFRVVRAGFAQKRKQLKNNLRALGLSKADVQIALENTAIDGARRAETLTLPEWVALTNELR